MRNILFGAAKTMTKPVLGYWRFRGYAQAIRLMLGYVNVDFVDKIYEMGDGPEFNRDDWLNEKFQLGLDFPNLPYFLDGEVKMSQSRAIMRHLARKHHLMGQTEMERNRCDVVAEQICDCRQAFTQQCYDVKYGTDFEVNGPLYAANLTGTFRPFEDFLGDNPWMAGKVITWADFLVWEVLDQHLLFKPSCLDELPKLSSYHQRFKEQPTIEAFVGSPKCFEGPVMGKLATWGGTYPVHPAF